jgi:hypothetical protein
MRLVMHGTAPQRVLVAEDKSVDFKSCQENRKGDEQRFIDIMNNPDYVITKYEDTEEGISAALETKKMEERMWRNSEINSVSFEINDLEDRGQDASALRAFRVLLRDYPQQPDFPNGVRPILG